MTSPRDSITLAALEQALAEVDPAALLVPPRILRRVIRQHSHLAGLGPRVPHRKIYLLHREALLAIVSTHELDLPPKRVLPERLILLQRPSAERLATLTTSEALTLIWRLLFHARVHLALDKLAQEGRLTRLDVRQRIAEIGHTQFDEIRQVLRSEDLLLPPVDDVSTYIEFVAVYFELRYFASSFLASYFPSIEDRDRIEAILLRDLKAESVFAATRLPGAPEKPEHADVGQPEGATPVTEEQTRPPRYFSDRVYQRFARAAQRVAPLGNSVRSAVLRLQAARLAQGEAGQEARHAALADVAQLAQRLQRALGFSDSEARDWEEALATLVDVSATGAWTPAMRLLYDLQKVCVDHERGVFRLDLFGWLQGKVRRLFARWRPSGNDEPAAISYGLKRPLPGQREVLISKHLRSASDRLAAVPLTGPSRLRLSALLHSAMHRAESNLRAYFKPLIEEAFDHVDLTAHNLPETVARNKLADELLDQIVERGYLTMSDLRDAISRNNLKLPDVTRFEELRYGDQVLQADRQLAPRLDGVYRRGEIYLRLPQQLSSLAFGTPPGRFLTKFVAIPFGGAFVVLEFVQHVVNAIHGSHEPPPELPDVGLDFPAINSSHTDGVHLTRFPIVFVLGLLILGLLYHPEFRRSCLNALRLFGRLLKVLFYDWPVRLLQQPWVRAIVSSWPFQLFKQYVFKPAVLAAILVIPFAIWSPQSVSLQTGVGLFVIANLLVNSRFGRTVDEVVTDWAVNAWHRFRIHVVATFLRLIMDIFQGVVDAVERVLYGVDEWLRFRAGEVRLMTMVKAVLAVIWSVVNYGIRFFVNVLIEPQLNPIKHFPVVTVGHKMILPLAFTTSMSNVASPLASMLLNIFPLSIADANTLCVFVVWLIPGVFGFVVWELKENWRLYAANRPPNLRPNVLGHHAETMLQLMRPGFRSGTLPKLYARLRRANRRAYWTAQWKAAGRQLHALHEVEEAVRRFVDRELVALLEQSRGWGGAQVATGEIRLGINRIVIELYSPDLGEDSLWLAFDEQSGWLLAGVHRRGWLGELSPLARRTFENALAGFYKMAGVDLVREEIEAQLAPVDADYDVTSEGLVAWRGSAAEPRLLCPLDEGQTTDLWAPAEDAARQNWPINPRQLLFSNRPISWQRWVAIWQRDQDPTELEAAPPPTAALLPTV